MKIPQQNANLRFNGGIFVRCLEIIVRSLAGASSGSYPGRAQSMKSIAIQSTEFVKVNRTFTAANSCTIRWLLPSVWFRLAQTNRLSFWDKSRQY